MPVSHRIFPDVEVSGMTISQSIEAPLTLSDTLTLGGHLQTHNGNGSGTVNCSWRTVLSAKSWSEVKQIKDLIRSCNELTNFLKIVLLTATQFEIGAGNGTLVSFRFFRTLSKRRSVITL